VTRLKNLGRNYGVQFPKGASDAVDKVAKEFVSKRGAEELSKVAKTHFRTALRAQGLPEPPKKEWRKPAPKRQIKSLFGD
jgi:ribonuclease HIII